MDIKVIKTLVVIGVFLVIAIYVSMDAKKKRKKKLEKRLKESWGKASKRKYTQEEYEAISHYFESSVDNNEWYIDDITWNDLNMDQVFKQMNICNSSAGQEVLYKMLRMPSDNKELRTRIDELSEFYTGHAEKRVELQKQFVGLGFSKYISLSDYIELIVELKSGNNGIHFAALVFLIASFVVCLFVNPTVGIMMIVASIAFSVMSYYRFKARVESYFICIKQIVRMVNTAKSIAGLKIDDISEYNAELERLTDKFSGIVKNSWLLESGSVDGSIGEMLMEYLRMLTHVDLIKFNTMVKQLGKCEKEVFRLMDVLGFMEASLAVASYRKMLPYWSVPEFKENTTSELAIKEAFHPLINKPVANSLKADKHVLLTGSNASGKSTFLRTIAINAVLAQGINTSISKEYKAPFYRVMSSMSLKDDLSNNNSYYIVEIKSLKRILDAADNYGKPVLCFIDEVLRGTNTVERIAASSEILKSLSGKNALCFAATHDIELTAILNSCFDNYHFQEEVTDEDVKFNFKLFRGPATTRNAIKLLNIIGYDKKIIEKAEKQASYFMENGIWMM